jgi:hypothetical protein
MNTTLSSFYPDDGPFRIPFSEKMHKAVQHQLQDNEQAAFVHLQAMSLQLSGGSLDKRDLLTLLYKMPLSASTVIDSFAINLQELVAIRNAEPVSIISCLECRAHLPDGDRRRLQRQIRILRSLGYIRVGDFVEVEKLGEVLCDSCARGMEQCYQEQRRAEFLARRKRRAQLRKMSPEEYRRTPEWGALRHAALTQAGNRCQLCSEYPTTDNPLDVHHNNYDRFGDELLVDLVVLCRRLHGRHHGVLPEAA